MPSPRVSCSLWMWLTRVCRLQLICCWNPVKWNEKVLDSASSFIIFHRRQLNVSGGMKSSKKKCYLCQFTTCAIKLFISEKHPTQVAECFRFIPTRYVGWRAILFAQTTTRKGWRMSGLMLRVVLAHVCFWTWIESAVEKRFSCVPLSRELCKREKEEARMIKLNYATFSRRRKLAVEKKGELKRARVKKLSKRARL